MPQQKESENFPHILYSCYSQKSSEGEQFIPEHIFGFTLSGHSDIYLDGEIHQFKEGDFRFLRRNQLTRFTKYPPTGGEFKSLSISMDQETLHSMSKEYNLHMHTPYTGKSALLLKPNPLFKNYFESLTPYLNKTEMINAALTSLKVKEGIMLLVETNPQLKDLLFDFNAPGKIDLEAFMNKNFHFNVELKRFAYLTGRSLATFKRDFEKVYHASPNHWLQQRRLQEAYYLIKEKGQQPSDVYLDVGFKDLSHFSFAFKKMYGAAPSKFL